ncbi:DUF4129 domain-containing protein [Stenotrophomonas humi]
MRIDQLNVVLRARSQWEAMELGTALVRRHAAAIWKPWLLLTLPVFALLNLAGWWLDNLWLSAFVLWWLKPAFERIPLYVISRGAFGAEPSTAETLRAQWNWGWHGTLAYLTWRRLSPARSLLMPVDLLEGGDAGQRSLRRSALGGGSYGHATLLTWTCWHFETMLQLAGVALFFMFVPVEWLSESLRATWELIGRDTPAWALIGFNLLAWAAMTLISPFFSGAGFGLYLNRRTALEAWDVEIAFRRLRERLLRNAPMLVMLLAVFAVPMLPAHAQHGDAIEAVPHDNHKAVANAEAAVATPESVFGKTSADTAGFRQAAARVYEDPQLGAKRTVSRWIKKPSDKAETPKRDDRSDLPFGAFAKLLALISESMLWIVVGIVVVALAVTARWWLPWLRGSGRSKRDAESPVQQETLQLPDVLPPDILGSARQLWQQGKPRHALALLYRASVDVLSQRADVVLPPGATEAQCLRASRRMPQDADRLLFARMVRTWQYAAYAGQLPGEDDFQALLGDLHRQYGWPA